MVLTDLLASFESYWFGDYVGLWFVLVHVYHHDLDDPDGWDHTRRRLGRQDVSQSQRYDR
jgi:hypothetical protein